MPNEASAGTTIAQRKEPRVSLSLTTSGGMDFTMIVVAVDSSFE
jgi:hypothetical protein